MNDMVEAHKIMNKIDSSTVPLGLFVRGDKWQLSRVDKELFNILFKKNPASLVAVYDWNTRLEWIAEDLKCAGITN